MISRRNEHNYWGPVIQIMDCLCSHHSQNFLNMCEQEQIHVIFLVPHTLNQCQPLDLLTLSLLKRNINRSVIDYAIAPQSNYMIKILGAWHQATPPHLVLSAFNAIGLEQQFADGHLYWSVNRDLARRVRTYPHPERLQRTTPMGRLRIPH